MIDRAMSAAFDTLAKHWVRDKDCAYCEDCAEVDLREIVTAAIAEFTDSCSKLTMEAFVTSDGRLVFLDAANADDLRQCVRYLSSQVASLRKANEAKAQTLEFIKSLCG